MDTPKIRSTHHHYHQIKDPTKNKPKSWSKINVSQKIPSFSSTKSAKSFKWKPDYNNSQTNKVQNLASRILNAR